MQHLVPALCCLVLAAFSAYCLTLPAIAPRQRLYEVLFLVIFGVSGVLFLLHG